MTCAVTSSVFASSEFDAPRAIANEDQAKLVYITALAADLMRSLVSPPTIAAAASATASMRKPRTAKPSISGPPPLLATVFRAPEVSASPEPPPMPHASLRAIQPMMKWMTPDMAYPMRAPFSTTGWSPALRAALLTSVLSIRSP